MLIRWFIFQFSAIKRVELMNNFNWIELKPNISFLCLPLFKQSLNTMYVLLVQHLLKADEYWMAGSLTNGVLLNFI